MLIKSREGWSKATGTPLFRLARLSGPTLRFPFARGDWNLADAYTNAAPHFRRVFSPRFFGCRFRFEWFRNPIGIAFFVVEQKPFASELGHKKSYPTSLRHFSGKRVNQGFKLLACAVRSWLLLKNRGRAADPLPLQVDVYFHSVGDLDEGYALVHAVVFTVEGHRSSDAA